MARRKRKLSRIYVISLVAHLLVGGAIALIPQEQLREVVAIALNEAPKPKEAPPPPPPPKPAAAAADRPARTARAPRAAAAEAPGPSAADNAARSAAFTDLGLTLDSSSSDGLAVPVAAKVVAPPPAPAVPTKPKILVAKRTEPECIEPLVKPRPLALVRPSYTEDARRARVEGRLRVELAVNDQGVVTQAKILDSLGHGLDEAALAAARDLRFAPATQCRKPVSSPFVIAMRFQLGS
jgi:protein TonB